MNDKTVKALIKAKETLPRLRDLYKNTNRTTQEDIEQIGKCIKELSLLLSEQCKQTEKYFELYTKEVAKNLIE